MDGQSEVTVPLWVELRGLRAGPLELLLRLGVRTPPVDPLDIAKKLGVPVRLVDFADYRHQDLIWADGNPEFWVKSTDHPDVQRLNIANLIGCLMTRPNLPEGEQASWMAACFSVEMLLPKHLLVHYYPDPPQATEKLAHLFRVPWGAMVVRLRSLGI